MAKGYLLSQADHDVLRRMIDWYRRSGMDHEPSQEERPISGAPETYVANVPAGGIPARSSDTPGSLECGLYRIDAGGLNAIGITRVIYNLALHAVEEGYVLVTRAKNGVWICGGIEAGGGMKYLARFTLDSPMSVLDGWGDATLENQYGPGADHTQTTNVHVRNMLTSVADTYLFSGASGAAGLAVWDYGDYWVIVQMECPPVE